VPGLCHDLVEEKIAVFRTQRDIGVMTGVAFE
jgi:hypothetical protein